MLNKPRSLSAATRLLAFSAVVGFYAVAALSGCGGGGGGSTTGGTTTGGNGGGSTTGGNPTPSPSASIGDPGRGGALSDGCSRGGTVINQPGWSGQCSTAVQPTRKWTVLLYMNGANDLEEYGNLNLNQMEQFGSDNNITFVAQFKRIQSSASYDDKSDGDWAGARRFVVRRDSDSNTVTSPIISTRADIDMGSKETLQEFIQWGVKTFPAERYAIVLWNHGAGWRSRSAKSPVTRGFSYDDEKETHIDTIEIPEAIRLDSGRKWDLVAWDSSLMQMMEVAYEIKDQTNWIVGSEESPPGRGYPYDRWVDKLIANPDADGRFVGEAICDAMIAGYGINSNITESLLDASKIAPLASAVNSFGASLLAAKGAFGNQIADAREDSEQFDYDENKDLLDFARLIKERVSDPAVQASATRVEEAARAAIVKTVNGEDHPNAKGLAIYLPSPNAYRRDDISQANGFGQRYTELLFARDAPNWQSFLTQGPQ
ncbi:MAG: hypothetical protein H8F28_17090 [Fibrella sp.]|nr:hypothetical protein [Armatimonadota bacterium]